MQYEITVYMDTRDVTPWVRACKVEIADSSHRSFELRFSAWSAFDASNQWDIYGTYDPAEPRQEALILRGIIPPDRQRIVRIGKGNVPYLIALGYDWVWMAKRKAPSETIVIVPGFSNVEDDVFQAIKNHNRPVGEYRVWRGVKTLHQAVQKLARAAGVRVSMQIPNYNFAPWVVPPELSYWKAIEKLTEPYAPVRYFNRWTNNLVIQDPSVPIMGGGNKLLIGDGAIKNMDVQPIGFTTARRVLLRVPPWR